jgi:hypothetical protein
MAVRRACVGGTKMKLDALLLRWIFVSVGVRVQNHGFFRCTAGPEGGWHGPPASLGRLLGH